jgi:hypothetical protein
MTELERKSRRDGKISALSFIIAFGFLNFGISEFGERIATSISETIFTTFYSILLLYFSILILVLSITFKAKDFQVNILAYS